VRRTNHISTETDDSFPPSKIINRLRKIVVGKVKITWDYIKTKRQLISCITSLIRPIFFQPKRYTIHIVLVIFVLGISFSGVLAKTYNRAPDVSVNNSLLFDMITKGFGQDRGQIMYQEDIYGPVETAYAREQANQDSALGGPTSFVRSPAISAWQSERTFMTIDGNTTLVNPPILQTTSQDGMRKGIVKYIVEPRDTISSIALEFGLRTETLLWTNNKNKDSVIRPGDKLIIPQVDGVIYTVARGDSLDKILGKFTNVNKNKVLTFNKLGDGSKLKVGQIITLPEAKPKPTPTQIVRKSYAPQTVSYVISHSGGSGHRFPYGYCTWYVASRRYVPWGGNAGTWLYNARKYGFSTGSSPRVGAIMVTRESWWGHVAYVERVSGNYVTISEMNHVGWGRISRRTISRYSRFILGYIY